LTGQVKRELAAIAGTPEQPEQPMNMPSAARQESPQLTPPAARQPAPRVPSAVTSFDPDAPEVEPLPEPEQSGSAYHCGTNEVRNSLEPEKPAIADPPFPIPEAPSATSGKEPVARAIRVLKRYLEKHMAEIPLTHRAGFQLAVTVLEKVAEKDA
jgi:hypothetical protein